MTRTALLALALAACSTSSASKLDDKPADPPPRNLVCERVAIGNPNAKCDAEVSGGDALNTHRARVTVEKNTVSCSINNQTLSVVCDGLFYQAAKQPEEPKLTTADGKPKAKAK